MKLKNVILLFYIVFFAYFTGQNIKSEETQSITGSMEITDKKPLTKKQMADWIDSNFKNYFQKYNLSCEAAIIRMISGAMGITNLSEDDILQLFPVHKTNPDLGLVMDEIDGDSFYEDGTINWGNYGAHADVVWKVFENILTAYSLADRYSLQIETLDDVNLKRLFKADNNCLGAIIWVAAYINGKQPTVNALGQVVGEHVQYISPLLDSRERFMVYDVWPWPNQPFRLFHCLNRDLFKNKAIIIRSKEKG